jgi:hypothetical protein
MWNSVSVMEMGNSGGAASCDDTFGDAGRGGYGNNCAPSIKSSVVDWKLNVP